MKLKNNKGFTLIEVVVAFAVLAIVSGTLLQMFVTSTKVNQRTYNKDRANILAVKLLEEFKATPEDTDIASLIDLSGAAITVSSSNISYFKYLGSDWSLSDATSYAYTVEMVTTNPVPVDNGAMSFYTDPVYGTEFSPTPGATYSLEAMNPVDAAHPDGDQTELLFQYTGLLPSDPSITTYGAIKDGKVAVYIKANPPLTTPTAITINLKNNAKLTMAGDGSYLATGTAKDFELAVYFINMPETLVTVNPILGGSSYSFVDASTVNTYFKTAQVKVIRRSDGAVLADQEAGKYVVQKQ